MENLNDIIEHALVNDRHARDAYLRKIKDTDEQIRFIKKYYGSEDIIKDLFINDTGSYRLRHTIIDNLDHFMNGNDYEIGLAVFALVEGSGPKLMLKHLDFIKNYIDTHDFARPSMMLYFYDFKHFTETEGIRHMFEPGTLIKQYLCSTVNIFTLFETLRLNPTLTGSVNCGYNILDTLYTTYKLNNNWSNLIFKFIIKNIIANKRKFNLKIFSSLIERSNFNVSELIKIIDFAISNKYATELELNTLRSALMNSLL